MDDVFFRSSPFHLLQTYDAVRIALNSLDFEAKTQNHYESISLWICAQTFVLLLRTELEQLMAGVTYFISPGLFSLECPSFSKLL